VSVQYFYKKLDKFTPAWAVIVIKSVGIFLSSGGDLEDKKRRMGSCPMWSVKQITVAPLLLPLCFSLFSTLLLYLGLGTRDGFLRDLCYGFIEKEVLTFSCSLGF